MKHKYFVELLLWMVVVIWAGNYTVGKFGMREISPLVFTTLRFLIAAPLIMLLLKYTEGSLNFSRNELPRIIVVGVLGIALYQTVFMAAVKYASVTTASLGLGVSPIFTALLGAATGQEKLHFSVLTGCFTAFSGLFLVINFGPDQAGLVRTFYGDALAITAGFLWGLYPILATPLLKKHSPLWVTGHSSLAGALVLLAFSIPELRAVNLPAISMAGWGSLLYSALPVTVISLVAWYYGIDKIGANQVMIYMYLIPPVAVAIAMLTIGETVTLVQGIGAIITIFGVFLAKRSPAKQTNG